MDERYIIDRIEGNYVITQKENGDMYEIFKDQIKGNFKEGDILKKRDKYFEIDESFTLKRRKQIEEDMKDMWEE